MEYIDTIIIGGGQAGLSVARYLKECSVPFVILEKESRIGTSWVNRYDSLILDSFAQYSQLENFPFPGDQKRQPTKDEVAHYLESFAEKFGLAPEFETEVKQITKETGEDSLFIIKTNKKTYQSKNVVIATGPFNTPYIPEYSKHAPSYIHQLHVKDYKNAQSIPEGKVLIVGGGNSGSEIAKELIEHEREVLFSYKGKLGSVTSSQFSQWIAYRLGVAHIPQESFLGQIVRWYTKGKSVGMDIGKLLKHENLISVGEVVDITPEGKIISKNRNRKEGDGKDLENIKTIIWATGYKSSFSIIDIPKFDPSKQKRGVTNILGLYVLNIRWQYAKSSSHLAGISRDAKYIASVIAENRLTSID